jgi:hypothetical protein
MANTFVNAGDTNISISGDIIYTCAASTQCLIHALYLSNIDGTNSVDATVEVTFDGGTTYVPIAKTVPVPADSTLILDKPLNLEAGDKIKITASTAGDLSAFASILEITS